MAHPQNRGGAVLVTGATGFIGRHVIACLNMSSEAGAVSAMGRDISRLRQLDVSQRVAADLSEAASVDQLERTLLAALESKEVGVFNAAHPERVSLKDIPKTAVRIAGRGSLAHEHPDTPRRDRVMDVGRMLNVLCFQPKVDLADGLRECHFE
jgi:nucleoside-diphosphate-sugar epimerase